jgi:hypothetical protein
MSDRWTVTTHRDGGKQVVVLRDHGSYISTAYSTAISLTPWLFNQTPWLRVQKTIERYERKADRLNRIEDLHQHYSDGMTS